MSKFTLVQHSGYGGGGGDPTWQRGLEQVGLTDKAQARVEKAGGLIFDTYSEADAAIQNISYDYTTRPETAPGFHLIPKAEGTFAPVEINGLKVYVPTDEERQRISTVVTS